MARFFKVITSARRCESETHFEKRVGTPFVVARCLILFAALLLVPAFSESRTSLAAARPIAFDAADYEGRTIASIEIVLEGVTRDPTAEAEFLSLLRIAPNTEYSAVRVRDSLQALLDSGRVANARVEVFDAAATTNSATPGSAGAASAVRVRFVIKRQARVGEVLLDLEAASAISEDELRARLNMLEPGAPVSEQSLRRNADEIQTYLRDRGFFRASVEPSLQVDPSGTRAVVTFHINPNEQARVASFNINVTGFGAQTIRPSLVLQPSAPFSRTTLGEDVTRIRQSIIAQGYLAPQLNDAEVTLDSARNLVTINLTGAVGPKVSVAVQNYALTEKKERELLPVMREGNIDQSAIVEGARRLRSKLQEQGYFFTEVTPVCTVTPPTPTTTPNGTEQTCENLNPQELSNRSVNIAYSVERGRRFKLTDIRIEGTNKLSYADVENDLKTQKATILGFIPYLGYGRGYTSNEALAEDKRLVESRMADLGYRKAVVEPRQGVSINGENLIITFVVTEGPLTRVAGIEVRGNQIYTAERLRDELQSSSCLTGETGGPVIIGGAYSRTRARADSNCLLNLYARNGYIDAKIDFSIIDLPQQGGDEQVRLVYTVTNEGDKVFVNRILISGNVMTKKEAILRELPLQEGDVLRADKLTEGERNLYNTDAFRQVIIRTEAAGETSAGFRKRDIIIDVEEKKPRLMQYGGGYSTDTGPEGLFELSNQNAFGQLRQSALRTRISQRQQLLRLEYIDPRFRSYGDHQFAPLALSVQYQRDTTITRFFRSTIDRGTLGVVQRLDAKGNPIDQFGLRTKEPTINRFTFNIETQRDLERKLTPQGSMQKRTTLLLRYNYEDVRLFNINSLLISDILRPDRALRLSRLAATLVRDTRDNPFDSTRGDFLTFDYALALRQLGGNISFSKLQANYRRYYKLDGLRHTVLAGNITLGLASLFNPRDRDGNGRIDNFDTQLPISERFFSGGSTTLRGFGFEEAGPRAVIPCGVVVRDAGGNVLQPDPCGVLRNQKGKIVQINPFTVPVGGNALAILNLEARVPITKELGIVPFYDGGNVFRNARDIFRRGAKPDEDPNFRQRFTHTVGLGFRIKTPVGGALSIDYGFLLNPPEFVIPQNGAPDATFRLKHSRLHFRFTQTF